MELSTPPIVNGNALLEAAELYLVEGLNPIPLLNNKAPKLPAGHPYLYNQVNDADLANLFKNADKLGIVCGDVSDGLEVLDFDAKNGEPVSDVFSVYMNNPMVKAIISRHKLTVVKTPSGGFHIYYRHNEKAAGSRKLAYWSDGKIMIETRGNGGYAATIPSPGYKHFQGVELPKIPRISIDERDTLIAIAENLTQFENQCSNHTSNGRWPDEFDSSTVWGRYNEEEVNEAKGILLKVGWKLIRTRNDGVEYWQRPGKDDHSPTTSATFGKRRHMFYVFTSNADGFKSDTAYCPFDIFKILRHGGNFESAVSELKTRYGITEKHGNNDQEDRDRINGNKLPQIPSFPIDGLPTLLRELINACVDVYKTPMDFWASAFFASTAVGLGNSVKLVGKYTNNPALWWLFVAPSGTGKSEPIDFALSPFAKIDTTNYKEFLTRKNEYEEIMNMPKKDRDGLKIDVPLTPPTCRQIILKDFTPEAMVTVHRDNPRGIVLHRDELMGWINDIGRYNKSGEVEAMLTIWSGKGMVVNRKGQSPLRIDEPCISIIGGVVVKKLIDLAKEGRADNGMVQRCMFVWPDFCDKQQYSAGILPPEFFRAYDDYVKKLLTIPEGNTVKLSASAEQLYEQFYNNNASMANAESTDFIKEMYAKLDIMALRIALIVHGMKIVCEGNTSDAIGAETMEYSIRVTEYFRATGLKVYAQIYGNQPQTLKLKDVILYCKNERGITNQSELARVLGVTQQYINKIFATKI